MSEFDQWADYYDIVHEGLPGEALFYVSEAVRCGGAVLELGCGTGRICIPMAMSGVHATGMDNSVQMLDICGEKLDAVGPVKGSLETLHGDMSDFSLGKRFDLIVMAYRTFMHLLTPKAQRSCLRCVRSHLAEGGHFIFNLWAARPESLAPFLDENPHPQLEFADEYSIPHTSLSLLHYHAANYDVDRRIIKERHRISQVDGAGRVEEERELSLTRSWFTPADIEELLHAANLETVAVLGDFEGAPFGPKHSEMIWIVRTRMD